MKCLKYGTFNVLMVVMVKRFRLYSKKKNSVALTLVGWT